MPYIRINDLLADGFRQAIYAGYIRATSGNGREIGGGAQTILSLTNGDKVNMYAVREGNRGNSSIQAGSHINIRRIA